MSLKVLLVVCGVTSYTNMVSLRQHKQKAKKNTYTTYIHVNVNLQVSLFVKKIEEKWRINEVELDCYKRDKRRLLKRATEQTKENKTCIIDRSRHLLLPDP